MSSWKTWASALAATACLGAPVAADASQITYTPVDPSFGGNPGNSSHLLSIANAQNNYSAPASTSSTATQTQANMFLQQLQSRFLSALASNVTDAIFGANPQDHGQIVFGDQTITFDRGLDAVSISILDASTGQTTDISVPILVSGGP